MEWKEYLIQSEKTLSHEFHCDDHKVELLLHATMGILTEFQELLENHHGEEDMVNIKEETADVLWYIAILAREYSIEMPSKDMINWYDCETLVMESLKETLVLLDILKKKLFYNKPIDEEKVKFITTYVLTNMMSYLSHYNIDMGDCLQTNINKLKSRYGDKFSSEKAIERDLIKERKILESKADAETFFNSIETPPKPNETLKTAAKKYKDGHI